jgi:ubiquinone biosynthesis monooxygenase Coq7
MPFLDKCILGFDKFLRISAPAWPDKPLQTSPARDTPELEMSICDKHRSQNMMRVNLAGEVAAQGLYRGQALLAQDKALKVYLEEAAEEELAHFSWCLERLQQLGGKPSVFNPAWYYGAFVIGLLAALASDKVSLGFLIATEEQVGQHLAKHLLVIPHSDLQSQAIIARMYEDELEHAVAAEEKGGVRLPLPILIVMQLAALVMTKTSAMI